MTPSILSLHQSSQRAEVDHVPVDSVPLALGGFQVHGNPAEPAVAQQVAKRLQAQTRNVISEGLKASQMIAEQGLVEYCRKNMP